MNSNLAMYIILGVIVVIGVASIIFLSNWTESFTNSGITNETANLEACLEIGCPELTNYIGSISSRFYYPCICEKARGINVSDMVCFETRKDAVLQKFYKGYCG